MFYEKVTLIQGSTGNQGMDKPGLKSVAFSKVFQNVRNVGSAVPGKTLGRVLDFDAWYTLQKVTTIQVYMQIQLKVPWSKQDGGTRQGHMSNQIDSDTSNKATNEEFDHSNNQGIVTFARTPKLPMQSIPGLIPINSSGERLNTFMSPPIRAQWTKFTESYQNKKLCNHFYLSYSCTQDACNLDHSPLGPDEYYTLQYASHGYACALRGKCRRLNCYSGHVCQNPACENGRVETFRMNVEIHTTNYGSAQWIAPDERARESEESSEASTKDPGMPVADLIML
jgi:hypothetical protein